MLMLSKWMNKTCCRNDDFVLMSRHYGWRSSKGGKIKFVTFQLQRWKWRLAQQAANIRKNAWLLTCNAKIPVKDEHCRVHKYINEAREHTSCPRVVIDVKFHVPRHAQLTCVVTWFTISISFLFFRYSYHWRRIDKFNQWKTSWL